MTIVARLRPPRFARAIHSYATANTENSVNRDEIAFFSRLSSQWWDEQGEFSFLHKMNPVRVQFIRNKLLEIARDESEDDGREIVERGVLRGLDVLDVGCGGGLLTEVAINFSSPLRLLTWDYR